MSAIKHFVGLLFFVYLALADDFQEPSEEPLEEEWPECDNSFMDGKYSIVHPKFCDRFFACQNGIPYLMQCEDGFGYLPFRGCKLLHLVDCVDRPQLQRPRGNKECKRLYGIFNNPKGCGNFFKCVNGTAVEDKCPAPLMFDDEHKVCRDGSKEELDACKQPVLLGCTAADGQSLEACTWFHCPSNDVLPFGDHSRHPYPGHCNFFIICLKDGSIKVGGCERGKGFDDRTKTCEPEEQVKACPKGRDGASLLKDMHKNSSQGLDDSSIRANL